MRTYPLVQPLAVLYVGLMNIEEIARSVEIGPLHDPVTWYGINYTGTQITQWDFQNRKVGLDWY